MKTLAERTGLRFTKRRPRTLPDPPYILAHCRAGWFVVHGRTLDLYVHIPLSAKYMYVYGVHFQLTQDKQHYSDGLIMMRGWHA